MLNLNGIKDCCHLELFGKIADQSSRREGTTLVSASVKVTRFQAGKNHEK